MEKSLQAARSAFGERQWTDAFVQLSAADASDPVGIDDFETGDGHPMIRQGTGVAFRVDPDTFIAFARSLPGVINHPGGQPLTFDEIVDFDLCWALHRRSLIEHLFECRRGDVNSGTANVRGCPLVSIDARLSWSAMVSGSESCRLMLSDIG